MPKFDYRYDDPIGYEGQLFGAHTMLIDTGLNKTGLDNLDPEALAEGDYESYLYLQSVGQWLGYGLGVQPTDPTEASAETDKDYVLAYTNDPDVPVVGVSVLVHQYERRMDPNALNGIPPGRLFSILRKGSMIVYSETAAAKYDPVYCRVALPDPNTNNLIRGRWRNQPVTGQTVAVPRAYYQKTITEPGLVPIRFDFTDPREEGMFPTNP